MKQILFFLVLAIVVVGCKKTEGDGGSANIKGKVYVVDFKDDLALKPDTMLASEEDIYIVYGSNEIINDKSTTNDKGEYGFEYLRPGNYSIIAYSKLPEMKGADTSIVKTVKISDKKATVTVDDIYINKASTGYATISGKLFVKDYNATLKPKTPEDNYYSGGEDIYIQKVGYTDVLKKETTSYDGSFRFKRLSKGTYKIFAYSKDTLPMVGGNGNDFSTVPIPSIVTCTIDSIGQQKIISDVVIIR